MNVTTSSEIQTRGRILVAADEQFSMFGPRKTSMEEIAERAGLSRATLYLHFSSKRDLYEALLRKITDEFVKEMDLLVNADSEAPSKFRTFVELTAETYTNNPIFLAALTENKDYSLRNYAGPIMADYRNDILKGIELIIRQGIRESTIRKVDVKETAYLLYELGTQLIVKQINGVADFPLHNILDVMDDIVAKGILTQKRVTKKGTKKNESILRAEL